MKRILFIIAAIAICVGIFLVTKSPAATGGNTYEWIAHKLPVTADQVPWVNYFFRKGMHLLSFSSLAVLLALFLPKRPYLFAWLFVTAYAATDEWHQLHVPGRTGSIADVMLDSCGALIGLGLLYLIKRKRGIRH
ncbi:VanZ family protein [Aciduricibacillus chroicocephali]|uniref:VanZ family protein n=1 Tax=Aciduricibacillus chroicocephali TaxID=3054939 RepID=A0ABY9KWD6_9BACI|nr:VanZ family protein [Bacillaceae bacterium 44XB]